MPTNKEPDVCHHSKAIRKTVRSINVRYWCCAECKAIIRFTLVTHRIGQCHAEAGRLVTQHFQIAPWKQVLARFYPSQQAFVCQGLMHDLHEHSWVEIGDHAFDTNYGAVFDRQEYYRVFGVSNIKRYAPGQFTALLIRHRSYCYFGNP